MPDIILDALVDTAKNDSLSFCHLHRDRVS